MAPQPSAGAVRPRLAHVISGLGTGGAERALLALLVGGLADQFECLVVSLGEEGTMARPMRAAGARVHAINLGRGRGYVSALAELRKQVAAFRPNVIQGWMYHGNFAANLSKRAGASLAWNVRHSLYDLALEKPATRRVIQANRFLSKRPAAIIYNSDVSRRQHEAFGFNASTGVLIPNGIDLERYRFSATARAQKRAELGMDDSILVVGHVARLHPMKDHRSFLVAADTVLERVPNARFVMVGKDVHGNSDEFASLAKSRLSDRIVALGERGDIPELLSAFDVFCLSSKWGEGFPNVLGEAMATGVPCVATEVGDSAAVIGDTGQVVAPGDTDALASGLLKMLTMSVDERQSAGQRARQRVNDRFALPAIVDRYLALYEKLL